MKLYSASLIMLFSMVFNYYCLSSFPINMKEQGDAQKVKQLVIEAVEYNGWVNEPDYKKELGRLYAGTLLTDLINSVEQFRNESTDWHTLTSASKCHIVYNDGNTALVLAYLLETNPEGSVTGQWLTAFKLHNTPDGWRITHNEIIWPLLEYKA